MCEVTSDFGFLLEDALCCQAILVGLGLHGTLGKPSALPPPQTLQLTSVN
jgi:hypothetical protein